MAQRKKGATAPSDSNKSSAPKSKGARVFSGDLLLHFLEAHPGFDLLKHDFYSDQAYNKKTNTFFKELISKGLEEKLKTRQRLMRVWPDHKVAGKLEDLGFDSAARIAATPEWRFQQDAGIKLNTAENPGLAAKIYASARSVSEKMNHVYANLHSVVASPHYRAALFSNVQDDLVGYVNGIPGYQVLFGSLDFCKCEECSSIFSPAAYFLDIMRITDEYITQYNTGIPSGMKLEDRRPDLFTLKLTCANTNNPVPTVKIINEVMEAKLQAGQQVTNGTAQSATNATIVLASSASSANGAYSGMLVSISAGTGNGQRRMITAYDGASKTATVMNNWETLPDNTSQYAVVRDIYSLVAISPFPFNLPWNLMLEQSRFYASSLGTSLTNIYSAFLAPIQWGSIQSATTTTVVFATTVQPANGSYVNAIIHIISGTGQGQIRRITAYDAPGKTATIDTPWTTLPQNNDQYSIETPGPVLNESLSISIEEVTQLVTPLITGPSLSPQYGYANLADIVLVQTLTPLTEFMWRTQLKRADVVALLTQGLDAQELAAGIADNFYINNTGETNLPYLQLGENTSGASPFEIIQNLSVKRLDRLNRFIRLSAVLGWSYASTNWVMQACDAQDITSYFLSQAALIKMLCDQKSMTPEAVCGLWYIMKNTGRVSESRPQDFFDTVYNNPSLLKGQNPYTSTSYIPFDPLHSPGQEWIISDNTGLNARIRSRLSAALNLNDNDLTEAALFIFSQVIQDPPAGAASIAMSYENLSWLYRVASMAQLTGMGMDAFLVYLALVLYPGASNYAQPPYGSFIPALDLSFAIIGKIDWLKKSGFTPYQLQYIFTGTASAKYTGPVYNALDIQKFVQSLAAISESSRMQKDSFVNSDVNEDTSAGIFDQMVSGGYIDSFGIMLTSDITFAQSAKFFPVSEVAFVSDNIDETASKEVFTLLTQNPVGNAFLLKPFTVNGVRYATLNENFHAYSPLDFLFVSGGAGQQQQISAYTGANRTATLTDKWATVPDTTSYYAVSVNSTQGTARSGSAYSITLAATSSQTDGFYNGMYILITAGTGSGQQNKILSYNGTTNEAIVDGAWKIVPDQTSVYSVNNILNSGFAQGGTNTTIILDAEASVVDGAYDSNEVAITADPKADLKRKEVSKKLITCHANIEHTSGLITQFEKLQVENCLQALAGFMSSSSDMISVLLPFAASVTDLAGYLETLLAPVSTDMLLSFLPNVSEQSFKGNLITDAESAIAYQQLAASVPQIVIPNVTLSYMPPSGKVSATFTKNTSLSFLFPNDPQADLKQAYVRAVLLLSQRANRLNLLVLALSRSILLVDKIRLTPDEAKFVLTEPGCCNISNLNALTLDNVISISAYKGLIVAFNDTTGALNTYFQMPKQTGLPNEKVAALARLTGWDTAQLCTLIGLFWPLEDVNQMHSDYGSVHGVARLKVCFDLSAQTGIDIFNLLNVDALSTLPLTDGPGVLVNSNWVTYEQTAQLLLGAANSKLGDIAFTEADNIIQKALLSSKRDALLFYLIWQLNGTPVLSFISTPSDLYQYLLLDVEMGACDSSSYIAQAIASVQLYLQRCRMMLEDGVTDTSNIGTAWWEWMMAYRVWEANRRIFLYPENYIDPTLYKYQSPAFKKFSEALQQSNIDDQSVTEAFTGYMTEFSLVSALVQCASYTTTIHDDRSGKDIERLFIFGHTNEQPYNYYYRTYDNKYAWTSWQRMKITIGSQFVSPVYAFKRLFIFWVELTSQSGSTVVSNSSVPNSSTISTIKFSFLNDDGSWASPQVLQDNIVINYKVNYALDPYVKILLPVIGDWFFNTDNIFWRKVYPISLPQESFLFPQNYPNNESIAINYGYGLTVAAGRGPVVPTQPPTNIDPSQYQFEYAAWQMASNSAQVSKAPVQNQTTFVPERSALVFDSGLSRQDISPVFINYMPLYNPTPYVPYLLRPASQLGINPTASNNIILDNYFSDNPASYPGINNSTDPPQLQLLNNISPNTTSITTVKNIVGSFIFDNGDEAFLATSQEKGIIDINKLIASDYNYKPFPAGFFYFYTSSYTSTPTPFSQLKFAFTRISTRTGKIFAQKLLIGGVAELLTIDSQQTSELPFSRLSPQAAVIPPTSDLLDFNGAYGPYFSEIFLHAPFLVASMLNTNQRFDEARKWYQYIFNPTQQPDQSLKNPDDRFWRYLPFRNLNLQTLIQILSNPAQIDAYNDDPFSPDAIAKLRPAAYAKAVVMKYIDNLIAWADNLYAQDTRESINQAVGLYVVASDLLGKRPELINNCPSPKPLSFNDVKAMYNNQTIVIGTAQGGAVFTITLASVSSNQTDAYTGMYIQITAGTGNGQTNYITAYNGTLFSATVANAWAMVPDSTSVYRIYLDHIPQFFINLENSGFNAPGQLTRYGSVAYNNIPSYFCVPENKDLVAYWDIIEDRLYKIRHCMNLQGEERTLALFAPPIDPRLLIAAAASGNAGMLTSGQIEVPIPAFRFETMIEHSRSFTSSVMSFGSALLNALEKKDSETLAVLQNTQEHMLLEMNTVVREQQINMYIANGASLQESLLAANERYNYYNTLVSKGLNIGEILNIIGMASAMRFNVSSSLLTAASAIAYLIPNAGSPFAMTYGGEQIGSSLFAAANVFQAGAVVSDFIAQLSITMANYQRRSEDWAFQAKQAQFDALGINYQVQSNDIQKKIAEQEMKVHQTTIRQNENIALFLQNKFTSADLYQWMVTRLSTVYFQAYTMAYELARETQRSFQYELNTDQSFVNFGYWDNLRKGLLAGEGLMLSLMQMEKAWIDKNVRPLEIEKTISLRQLDPNALMQLIETGTCIFSLGEKLFDDDYPGFYGRKIKNIAVSIPAVLGPYQDFHVMLTQLTNQVILKPDLNAVNFLLGGSDAETPAANILRSNWNISESIAVSRGVNDSGLFELNFRDERYLPFEGTGAVSSWRLSMPKSTNLFSFLAVSDIVIQLKYTAFNGGTKFRDDVQKLDALRTINGSRFFNMAQNFSQQWYSFMNIHPLASGTQILQFSVDGLQPPHVENPVITGFYFRLNVPEGIVTTGNLPYITISMGNNLTETFNLDSNNACTGVLNNPPPAGNVTGPASISFALTNTPADMKTAATPGYLNPDVLLNAVLILFWSGENSSGS
jgi:hypothetical protein